MNLLDFSWDSKFLLPPVKWGSKLAFYNFFRSYAHRFLIWAYIWRGEYLHCHVFVHTNLKHKREHCCEHRVHCCQQNMCNHCLMVCKIYLENCERAKVHLLVSTELLFLLTNDFDILLEKTVTMRYLYINYAQKV